MSLPERPAWQRDPIFKFFAGLKLAMLLLAVLTAACIFGTIYESGFDAKVANYYVYGARWFNIWLLLLGVNLTCAAFSRWPWKKHHVAFLMAHLGIITLMTGALIGKMWGIEGTMTMQEGEPANNVLTVNEKILEVTEPDGRRQAVNAEVFRRIPSPEHPRYLTRTADKWTLDLTGYTENLEVAFVPKKAEAGQGMPAVRVNMATGMMAKKIDNWIMAGHPRQATIDLGLATITLLSGTADLAAAKPAPTQSAEGGKDAAATAPGTPALEEVEETIFSFQKMPDQIGRVQKGTSTGAKLHLSDVTAQSKGKLTVELNGQTAEFQIADLQGKPAHIPGTELDVTVKDFWPDFRMNNGKPESASQDPNNPAVLAVISGKAVPAPDAAADATAAEPHGPPSMAEMANSKGANSLKLYIAPDGSLTYELSSRKLGHSAGTIKPGEPLVTGWADWKFTVTDVLRAAVPSFVAQPVTEQGIGNSRYTEGIQVRARQGDQTRTEWVPLGWQIGMDLPSGPLRLIYGYHQEALPIGIQLTKFEVKRYPGTDRPSSFKSNLAITAVSGETATGSCWMNNPLSFPGSWLNTWSGLTYKISQSSWNPQNPSESTVQVLRDPGWGLKWIGSLLITGGIYCLFYVPKFRRKFGSKKPSQSAGSKKAPASV